MSQGVKRTPAWDDGEIDSPPAFGRASTTPENLFVCALGCGLVTLPGSFSGGYFAGSWTWLTVALASIAGLRFVLRGRIVMSRAELVVLVALASLALWTLLSSFWAVADANPVFEARRTFLYVVAFASLLLWVEAGSAFFILTGALTGITLLSAYAIGERALQDKRGLSPFEGNLLVGSLGYANALGILAAVGTLLAIGLAAVSSERWLERTFKAATAPLAITLALTESKGAWLALGVGLVVALGIAGAELRDRLLSSLVACLPACVAAVALAEVTQGAWLLIAVIAPTVLNACLPTPRFRWRGVLLLICGVLAVAIIAAGSVRMSHSFGHRGDYWQVALHDARSNPLLGSGAGSFASVWLDERPVPIGGKNAHSLYLETLAELGPLGLGLVGAFALLPLFVALRWRRLGVVPVAAGAYGAFLIHVGLDWDWQLPAVVFAALTAAAAILTTARTRASPHPRATAGSSNRRRGAFEEH
jgi:O-antigen ligase